MNIEAKRGTTIKYNGSTISYPNLNYNWTLLNEETIYKVSTTVIYDFHTDVFLIEFGGNIVFNSEWFDDLKEDYQI